MGTKRKKEKSEEEKINLELQKEQNKKLDSVKDTFEKAYNFVGDAAKITVDFAGKGLKEAQKVFKDVSKNLSEEQSRKNIERYKPIFSKDVPVSYPKMISIVDFDKRMGIKECEGAVGFEETINGIEILGIYKKEINKFGRIEYYPDKNPTASIYYVHPINNLQYIEITEYFSYLKEQRITELEYIAQELGAKHFKVEIMEETLSNIVSKNKADVKIGAGKDKAGISIEKGKGQKAYESIGIASELTWPGREPREPKLNLWANNESIKNLIKQRLSSDNRLQSKTFRLDYNTSSGIKEKEAAKIDGVLKTLKFQAAGSIQNEAKKESKRRLEYTIDF